MDFQDKVIIITGASVGIGAALARELARRGGKLVLAARDAEKLAEVAADCPGALVVPTDVTDRAACQALIEKTISHFGRLDVLVNNAGRTMWARLDELHDLAIIEDLMRLNYFGAVYCTHAALPHLKQSRGLIVAISSVAGKTGVPTRTGYAASKHAMQGFFDSLRIELADSGVGVTVVCPDFVLSEIHKRAIGPDGRPLGKSPLQQDKIMSAEDCARLTADAMAARKREVLMSRRARLGMWLKLLAPTRLDAIAQKAIQEGK
jgi:short-subunit dehydrogenase